MTPRTTLLKRLLVTLVGGTVLLSGPLAMAITKQEVMTLSKLGIPETEIIKAIDKDRTVFELSVAEILELKKAAVPERVIKYMLASPKTFGSTDPGSTSGPTTTVVEQPQETEEERLAREERMRQEAQKLVEEKRKAEEVQRKAYAQGVLASGRRLGDQGKYVQAIQAFQRFMDKGGYADDSEEAYFARFGIANALWKAGLLQAAASQLVDLVLDGPDKPFFQTAFQQLRHLRKKIDYSPPELDRLADMAGHISTYSQGFQDEFNYVSGEFFHEGTEWTTAVAFLDAVTPASKDYGKAQYLKGFMEVQNDLYRSAVQSFQRAIVATEENSSDPEVRDLSFLALARIAYKVGDYDAAIYYYRKIPAGSYKQATAFYESSWVYFLKGDYSRAVGTFHTLDSPYFSHYFFPEMWILEATAYLNFCQFDRAKASLQRFETDVMPMITPLEEFVNSTTKPEEYFNALVSTVAGKESYGLPERLVAPVLADVEFYNIYRTIKQIDSEISRLKKDAAALGVYGSDMVATLVQLKRDRIRAVGFTIQRILMDSLAEIQKFQTKYIELGIDIEDIEIEEADRRQAALDAGEPPPEERAKAGQSSQSIIGADKLRWNWENEYWRDEIGTYRSNVSDLCVVEE